MKKLFFLIAALACFAGAGAQTVGIGTAVPDTNVVLDIYSTNKGVLIPRILDTARVTNPLEGLIIYNKNTRSPYYYNGNHWLSLGSRLPSSTNATTDVITYKVTGPDFSTLELPVYAFSNGLSISVSRTGGGGPPQTSAPSFSSFNVTKEQDVNTPVILKAASLGTLLASIEFKVYATGSANPYMSYRFKNIIIDSYQASGSAGSPVVESISINFENYGFKDWVNNKEFGFSVATNKVTTY